MTRPARESGLFHPHSALHRAQSEPRSHFPAQVGPVPGQALLVPPARKQTPLSEARSPRNVLSLLEARWFGVPPSSADSYGHWEAEVQPTVQNGQSWSSFQHTDISEGKARHSQSSSSANSLTSARPRPFQEDSRNGTRLSSARPDSATAMAHRAFLLPGAEKLSSIGDYADVSNNLKKAIKFQPSSTAQVMDVSDMESTQLGTWTTRQKVFSEHLRDADSVPAQAWNPESTQNLGKNQKEPSEGTDSPPVYLSPLEQRGTEAGWSSNMHNGEDEMHAAWRWRFSRKWQMEQAKQFDPSCGDEDVDEDDGWDGALGYMNAVAGGLQMQIARTTSIDRAGSTSLMSPSLTQSMLLDSSVKESVLRDDSNSMDATNHLVSVARKAQVLLQQQHEIERQVDQRWEITNAAPAWIGQQISAVQIDSWGRFPFCLARLVDQGNRQKLLVFGKNSCDERQNFAALEHEVLSAAARLQQPVPRLDLLGTGFIRWSAGHQFSLLGTVVHSTADPRIQVESDVGRLVSALVNSSLPAGYKVTTWG